jgi:hypothetical protein
MLVLTASVLAATMQDRVACIGNPPWRVQHTAVTRETPKALYPAVDVPSSGCPQTGSPMVDDQAVIAFL